MFIVNSEEDKSALLDSSLTAKMSLLDRAGVSPSSDRADHLSILLKASDIASHDCFVHPAKRISQYGKGNKGKVKQWAERIVEALERGQSKNLKELLSGMTAYFAANRLGIEDAVFLWNAIAMHISEKAETDSSLTDIEFLDYMEMKEKFSNLEALKRIFMEQLSSLEQDQPGDANSKFKELLLYTQKHYHEELFLKDLSSQFFINVSYCCELFKKVTGMTFSQYMTDLRMRKACELLQNSALVDHDVCKSVGYSDYFYFNKVFKRYSGATPSKYRKRENGNAIH